MYLSDPDGGPDTNKMMALTEAEFRTYCDAALNRLNRALDVVAENYDAEVVFQNGVLSIEIEDPEPGKIVISPQAPTRQIWISAQSTSFKLDWAGSSFVLKATGETLDQLVGRLVGEQLGVPAIPLG
jgi:iron donor protein CyaY